MGERDNIVKILNLHIWHFQQIILPPHPPPSHGGEDLRLLVLRKRVVPPR